MRPVTHPARFSNWFDLYQTAMNATDRQT